MIAAFLLRHWITVAVGFGLVLGAFSMGWQVRSWKCSATLLKAEQAAAKTGARLRDQAHASANEYEHDRRAGYEESYRRQEQIRTIYKDRIIRSDCAVPDDARRVLSEAVDAANTPRAE
jgi:hypothetical protein